MNKQDFLNVMASTKGAAIASMVTDTAVGGVAAKYKAMSIRKVTTASIMLFNGLKDADPYLNKIAKTSDSDNATDFEKSETFFEHSQECYSLVSHKKTGKLYLYALYNSAKSTYYIDGKQVNRDEVAIFLTPSAAKTLMDDSGKVYNLKNDVYHSAIIRTISLENVVKLTANGQTI